MLRFLLAALAATPHLTANRIDQAPVIDGRLDDAVWQAGPWGNVFVQKFPDEGRSPTEATRLQVLYDDDALYIGVDCEQRGAPLVARLTRRDRPVEADFIEIDLAPRREGVSAFRFSVNAAGVLSDALLYNDTESSADWDENWEASVSRTDRGWSAEFRIPLRILRFGGAAVQDWGFQVRRYISARQETDEWAFVPRDAAGEVSHYGRLENLTELKGGHPLELRPFVVGRIRQRDPVDAMLAKGTDSSGSAGLDLKWHAARDLTLDATVNPDFAQVEADQLVLNLTNFEVEYPEKRPFFLEGTDAFATPVQVLYTRRIGQAPGAPTLLPGEKLVDAPDPAALYGAAKLTGTLGRRLTVGLLSAVTSRTDVQVQSAAGSAVARETEPLAAYNVLRLRQGVGGNSHLGLIASTTDAFEPGTSDAHAPMQICPTGEQIAAAQRCFHDAYVGGVDGRWRSRSGDYAASGQVLGSLIEHGPPRVLRDGTVIESGDSALGGIVTLAKEGGKHWIGDLLYEGYGRKLDYNDLGYMQRQNLHHVSLDAFYRTLDPGRWTLETRSGIELYDRENLGGLKLARGYQVNTSGKLRSFWTYFVELHYRESHFDDREVGDGTALERDGLLGLELSLHSDPRRRVVLGLSTQSQAIFDGLHFEGGADVIFRLLPQLDLELLPTLTRDLGEPRYFAQGVAPGELLFGKLDATSLGTTLRGTYTFTPRLTLQTYVQVFLASLHYSDFSSYKANPDGPRPAIRLRDLAPAPTPMCDAPTNCVDSEQGALNVNVVLRWEYKLGSTLFLVYTRSQVPNVALLADQASSLDWGAIRRAPTAQALLLKLSYWWG